MSPSDQFWIVMFLVVLLGVVAGHVIDRRRQRSIACYERKRRERKAEVERAARKAL